jgi:hypothetical protein
VPLSKPPAPISVTPSTALLPKGAGSIIAEDLGLKLWWKPVDVRKNLEQLAQADTPKRRRDFEM